MKLRNEQIHTQNTHILNVLMLDSKEYPFIIIRDLIPRVSIYFSVRVVENHTRVFS